MSKKKTQQRQKHNQPQPKLWKRRRPTIVIGLILCLGLTTLILAQWKTIRRSFSPLPPPLQTSPTPQLSKEYIYAGGRLIATEEPNGGGTSPLSAPSSLIATGTSSPSVNLSWGASTGGTVSHYQVERCQNISPTCYSVVAPNVPATSPTINYTDTTVSAGVAYLYRVRAVDSSNNFSGYSSIDLATAITFVDDPLNPSGTRTNIKAQHITELRQAVNAVRALANLSAVTWTNNVQVGSVIRAVDVQEMRTTLDQARSALGLSPAGYTNQPLAAGTTLIKKDHIEELRLAMK